jgi:hypothetical protein
MSAEQLKLVEALEDLMRLVDPSEYMNHCECDPSVGYTCKLCGTPLPELVAAREAIAAWNRRAALGNAGEVVKWTPVSERLPESNTPVLASVTGELGKKYVIRATYAAEKTVEAGEDDAACTYDEDTDTYWVDAGWYEDNSECEVNYAVSGVTDWMPLPSPAGSTLTYADTPAVAGDTHAFKNFHRSLCDRFGYEHDEVNWRRDLLSLEEWIASTKAPALSPLADGKVMAFVNIGGGQWQARECVLTPLAAAELAAQHASSTRAPAVAAEPVEWQPWRKGAIMAGSGVQKRAQATARLCAILRREGRSLTEIADLTGVDRDKVSVRIFLGERLLSLDEGAMAHGDRP